MKALRDCSQLKRSAAVSEVLVVACVLRLVRRMRVPVPSQAVEVSRGLALAKLRQQFPAMTEQGCHSPT